MKYLLIAFSFLSLAAHAGQVQGDWQSSGDAPMEYWPDYAYRYKCQLELSDDKSYSQGERHYKALAIAKFELSRDKPWATELSWEWLRLKSDREESKDVSKEEQFSVEHASAGLRFEKGASPKEDQVQLNVSLSLPIGDLRIPFYESELFARSQDELRLKAHLGAVTKDAKDFSPRRSAFLLCTKSE